MPKDGDTDAIKDQSYNGIDSALNCAVNLAMGGFIANVGKNGDGLEQSVGKYVPKPNLWKTGRIVNLVSGLMTIETLLPQKQGQGNLNGSQKLLHVSVAGVGT